MLSRQSVVLIFQGTVRDNTVFWTFFLTADDDRFESFPFMAIVLKRTSYSRILSLTISMDACQAMRMMSLLLTHLPTN